MSLKSENSKKPILLLVDGHSLAFRSFYAFSKGIDGGLTTKEGFPTSVTYGFLKSLLDNCKNISPEGVCITFDTEKPTFRHELDPNYKANRDVAPDVFFQDIEQLEIILEESLNLPIFKSPGYEADDLLGTIANDASSKGWCVNILSGDRDLFQLVDDQKDIYVLYMGGGPYAKSGNPTLMNENGVKEKLGVAPERVVDLKALTGDSSDNIPGIKGVGPKTAINLLKENDTLDGIYQALDKIQQNNDKKYKGFIKGSVIDKLRNDKHNAFLSRDLAKINTEVPLILSNGYELKNINQELLSESLKKLELSTLLRQIDIFNSTFSKGGFDKNNVAKEEEKDPKVSSKSELENSENKIPKINVTVVNDFELLDKLIQRLDKTNQIVSLDTETNSLNPIDAELVGIGLCLGEKNDDLFYIPLGHQTQKETPNQLSIEDVFSKLRTWIEDPKKEKALQNSKFDRQIFFNHGLDLKGVTFDTLLADYILNNQEKHGLSEISFRLFGFKPPSFKETVGKNKDFSFVDINEASIYCGYDVFLTFKIVKIFKERFSKEKDELIKLFEEIELPLEPVLSQMEMNGITIDIPYLNKLSKELKSTLEDIESKVYELAKENFNLSSPKQLGEILFEKLNLDKKKSRKTKTGWSTDAVVLERLIDEHEIIQHLIKHRTLSKLLSTYIDALPNLINEKTGRVHTNFNQAATATGRLSSSNPNLQNIPARTEYSRRIRKAFLPERGCKLLSADYSQIELRILAHLANEEILINAFQQKDDIHSLTARLIFNKKEINSDERRVGKTINFGIIYGISQYGLAKQINVSNHEAEEFLNSYFAKFPEIKVYMDNTIKFCRKSGYVNNIFGRRSHFNGINDKNFSVRNFQERAAINAPIQGSASEVMRLAMIRLDKKLSEEKNSNSKMLLQIHDELIFEIPKKDEKVMIKLIEKEMTSVAQSDYHSFSTPLTVDINVGDNWGMLH